jgi:hypothetical protein
MMVEVALALMCRNSAAATVAGAAVASSTGFSWAAVNIGANVDAKARIAYRRRRNRLGANRIGHALVGE